jgi:hypothetical protein
MTRSIIILSLFQILLVMFCVGQSSKNKSPDDTLAMVDSWPVTSRDLFERLELMPFEEKLRDHDFEAVKRKAVESLVGERLLAFAFKDSDVPDQWHMGRVWRVLEKMLVRDEMYKRDIRDNASIRSREVQDGLRHYSVKRRLLMIPCNSMAEARDLSHTWRRLRSSGESNSSILTTIHRQADTVLISFGSADTALENVAFSLKDTLSVSEPVQTTLYGVVVVSLWRDEPNRESMDKSPGEREKRVKQILSERKEAVLANDFVNRILCGNRMEADTGVFRLVARRCWELICSDSSARRVPKGYRFTQNDLYEILGEFRARLDSPIARGSFGELSLGDFLESLMYYDFSIPSLRPKSFVISFFEILRAITEAEMIAKEGLKRGYQNRPEVFAEESKWMYYWRSRYAEFAVVDTARMQQWEPVWSMWRNHTALVESTCVLSVQEVLRPDSLSASVILTLIRNGKNLDSLAEVRSIRTEWAPQGGRSGWFHFKDHIGISAHGVAMNVGDISGPFQLPEGFSVFRLLGRRFEGDSAQIQILLEQEARRMKIAHQQSAINRYIAQQAIAHRVDIYYGRIREVNIANVNMVTRRMIGFGGRMNASPLLLPQWEWVTEWERIRQLLQ